MKCAICDGRYYKIRKEDEFCELHEKWLVTVCSECHKACYSDVVHICPRCLQLSGKVYCGHGFTRDRRAILRRYGLE